jgi:hypothetical protein
MASYKATIKFDTLKNDPVTAFQDDLNWYLSQYNPTISGVERVSITAEEAIKEIKEIVSEYDTTVGNKVKAVISRVI